MVGRLFWNIVCIIYLVKNITKLMKTIFEPIYEFATFRTKIFDKF